MHTRLFFSVLMCAAFFMLVMAFTGCARAEAATSSASRIWQPADLSGVAAAGAPSAAPSEAAAPAKAVTVALKTNPDEVRLSKAVAAFKAIPHPAEYQAEVDAICSKIAASPALFISDIKAVDAADTEDYLTYIDKTHFIGADYEPADLVPLVKNDAYPINRNDLSLRAPVEEALTVMANAAKTEGLSLLVSSTYRSYAYQEQVFAKWVRIDGLEEAERESARAGTSQHQLGTAIDFGSIEDDYAETAPCKWLTKHAAEYGFSLSFPQGYEPITGFRWECWHFRYIGVPACELQKAWFNDIQQYMIEFVACWRSAE